ncbi:helicase-associated domain-containing protein [Arthrobacter sp. I2-34]|uniref:Helicase-associated domain-containing protein n=1 Tax=Arthrobacter hankyongi TaxID=2904801 RepID=A0ABS9L337_9MICC|nr:helicase-associated domain-containing protein [Arthrobacter hankyongi]MCG2621043.1 helicase-associated domain-containing protein [Arthrobacter hankyongi]
MSSIRALALDLAARSDRQLRTLLATRPDLCHPAVPDFPALAARACTRISLQRALENLTRPQLDMLAAVVLSTNVDSGTAADAATLQPLLRPASGRATLKELDGYLAGLHALALLVRTPPAPSRRHRAYLPVTNLDEVLGPYPAGLGRPYQVLASSNPQTADRLTAATAALHRAGYPVEPMATGTDAAAELERWLADPRTWPALLSEAPEATGALLRQFRRSPVGAVPHAGRMPEPGSGATPVDWLLARGLLVPLDAAHVELPRSVGLAARQGAVAEPWLTAPPQPDAPREIRDSIRDNAAYSAVADTLRMVTGLLDQVRSSPVATLRAGGVGVREARRLAEALRTDPADAGWLLELAAAAGLIRLDVDTSRWVAAETDFGALPRHLQWQLLAAAWLALHRAPALLGEELPSGSSINPLAAEASRPDAPAVRRRLLECLGQLQQSWRQPAAARSGTSPAISAADAVAYLAWHQPRLQRRFERLVPGILAEAARLGLVGSGALTELGAALAGGGVEEAAAVLERDLPAPLAHFLLQADLTAVAPGYLEPEVARELALLSDAEGQGPAAIYRFSAGSLRRALDAGRDGTGILDFLTRHAATEVPQPLRYLVEDTAARHGTLRAGPAGSYLRSDDESALEQLLADPRTAPLGLRRLAPTVLVARAGGRELLQTLRGLGYSPAPEAHDGAEAGSAAHPDMVFSGPARTGAALPGTAAGREAGSAPAGTGAASFPVRTNPWAPTGEQLDQQLALLRGSAAAGSAAGVEDGPLLGLETLRTAIRQKRPVRIGIVEPGGDEHREVLLPLSVGGGRVRVYDPDRQTERVVPIHRVMDIELAEPAAPAGAQTTKERAADG